MIKDLNWYTFIWKVLVFLLKYFLFFLFFLVGLTDERNTQETTGPLSLHVVYTTGGIVRVGSVLSPHVFPRSSSYPKLWRPSTRSEGTKVQDGQSNTSWALLGVTLSQLATFFCPSRAVYSGTFPLLGHGSQVDTIRLSALRRGR